MKGIDENYSYGGLQRVQHRGSTTIGKTKMMHPSYEAWKDACDTMMRQKRRLTSYFQWYPFSVLSETNWEILSSETFFSTYIQDGAFLICYSMRFTTKGFIQKQGAVFRDSVLVSPILFLYLLAFGIEYQRVFVDPRSEMACEYAGDIANNQAQYKQSYRRYCAHKRVAKGSYSYYLKTDITNFFGSINVDRLISKMQDYSNGGFSATDGLFLRALMLYCGEGKFPTIQNHPTLSFLATKVFLSDVDVDLSQSVQANTSIDSFKLVRYVDDLFVFFDVKDGMSPFRAKEELLNKYADILRLNGLTLNQSKVEFGPTSALSLSEAPESCVDFSGLQTEDEIDNAAERMAHLFDEIAKRASNRDYLQQDFNEAIELAFTREGEAAPPITAFRACLYRESDCFHEQIVIDSIRKALDSGKVTLSYNTAELTKCILSTNDGLLIRKMLNTLFKSRRNGTWSSIDALVAINYLIGRGMMHEDLLKTLKEAEPGLDTYIRLFCTRDHFATNPASDVESKLVFVISNDIPSKIQFANQLYHKATHNYFEQVSYMRAFFDRFSTLYKRKVLHKKQKSFLYQINDLFPIYSSIDNSKKVLREAEKLRQRNPLIHASSELITDSYKKDIREVIESLIKLIASLLKNTDLPIEK